MKFTLSWLKDHIDTSATLDQITEQLVNLGLEVESVNNPADRLKGFVVAKVVEREKHPNADRLSLCKVDAGTGELLQVVCGGTNVRQNMMVAFAPVGAVIPASGTTMKKGVIRDVESCGMLCSSNELLLGDVTDGSIMDLETDAKPGADLATTLGLNDPVIELSVTPNRSDCFGVRGIARDLVAAGLGTLKPLAYKQTLGKFDSSIKVTIDDSKACPDFRGAYIRNVKNGHAPDWMRHRLEAIGLRPISVLVDITNYITYDLGRPLHVFDADKIKGNLTVRLGKSGESFKALNGKDYPLTPNMTVVADDSGVLALGGIMGGESSEATESTTNVFIECALFDPIRIALTGRELQILSDSRTRLERGVDPLSLDYGMDAAIQLVLQLCGGETSHVVIANHAQGKPKKLAPKSIELTQHKLWSLTGYEVSLKDAKSYLDNLGFQVTLAKSSLTAIIPTHRPDIEGPADLVEEILRLVGYDNVPAVPLPQVSAIVQPKSKMDIARLALSARGFNEAITWSFMAEEKAGHFGWKEDGLRLSNPISIELSIMRPSILPNLIDAAVRNANRGIGHVRLFEVGPQFASSGQSMVAAGLRAGSTHARHWLDGQRPSDVYDAKADLIAVLEAHGLTDTSYQIEAKAPDYYHPGRSGTLRQGNRVLAHFGEIHPRVAHLMDAPMSLVGFEIFLDILPQPKMKKSALDLSAFQPLTRDFAFVVDGTVTADQVVKTIQKVDKNLITDVTVFDVYVGDKVDKGKKSIALEVRLEPTSGTLTDAEIQDISSRIITQVEKATGAVLRG